ncbi:hypothetical protein D3C77_436060 [compost metagenome]
MACDQYPRRGVLHAWWQHANRAVINDGTVINSIEFGRFMLDQLQLELVPLRPSNVTDVELHQLQVVIIQRPTALGLWQFAVIGHNRDLPAGD